MNRIVWVAIAFFFMTPVSASETYVVKRGDYLMKIAHENGVAWQALMFANEQYLRKQYDETCSLLHERYTRSVTRRGHFCNERKTRAYANTLKSGWKLVMPTATPTKSVDDTVSAIVGTRVAVVIDDTGSMHNNRQLAAELYFAALRKHGKDIVGVFLYADGDVRRYDANANVTFLRSGSHENTFGALQEAAKLKPNHMILLTDEEGNDWDWSKVPQLPPVTAHCLPTDPGLKGCETSLTRLATMTKGQYRSTR